MKLFIKRDISAENIIFTIFDEIGEEKYNVVSKSLKSNYSMSILTTEGSKVCRIRKLPLIASFSFLIKIGKKSVTVVCVPTNNGVICHLYGTNLHLIGFTPTKGFSLVNVDNTVKAVYSGSIGGVIEIFDETCELLTVAATVCVNLINTIDNHAVQAV